MGCFIKIAVITCGSGCAWCFMKDFKRSISFASWRERIAFSVGVLGKELVQGLINLCIFAYCLHVLHLEAAFLCALYLGFHVLGTIANPIIGFLVDNTSSRFGKYKPWIFCGSLLNLLALVWMYHLPEQGGSIYLAVTLSYALWSLSFFMIDTASWPMLTIFSSDSSTRDAMASVPCIATSIGTFFIPICSVPLLHYYPTMLSGPNDEYTNADIMSIIILVVSQSALLLFIRTKYIAKRQARSIRRNSHNHMLPPYQKDAIGSNGGYCSTNDAHNLYARLAAQAALNYSESQGSNKPQMQNFKDSTASEGIISSSFTTYDAAVVQNNVKQCYNNVIGYFDRANVNGTDDKMVGYSSNGDNAGSNSELYASLNNQEQNHNHEINDISAVYAEIREATMASSNQENYVNSFNELSPVTHSNHQGSSESLIKQIKNIAQIVLHNDQLMVLFICGVLINIALGITVGSVFNLLNANNLFNNHSIYTALLVGCFLQITCMALYEPMVRMLSRAFVFNFSVYLFIGGAVILFLAQNASDMLTALITAALILINCGLGMCHVSLISMTVDTVDYGEFKLSQRNDALIFSMRITSVHLGSTISFFFFGGSMAATFVFEDSQVPLPEMNSTMATIFVAILCLTTLFIYSAYYKLNGSFYRNVLNNLQYLRQNFRSADNVDRGPFMLRYALDESTMIVKLKASNQDDIIRAMVQKLSKVNAITSEHDYLSDLNARLELGPCGVAEGIALPHAKSSSVLRATVVVATLDTPIDLGSLDGRKSDLIFLLASPDDGETHLKLLGRLSLLLNEPGFADKLRDCGSTTEIFERLVQCEKHVVK